MSASCPVLLALRGSGVEPASRSIALVEHPIPGRLRHSTVCVCVCVGEKVKECVSVCVAVCVLLIREKDFKFMWMLDDDHCHPYNDTYVLSTNLLSNDAELYVHM